MTEPKVILVLGTGATVGGRFKVLGDHDPPMDRSFFKAPATKSIFAPEKYPALSYYQKDDSLESTWSQVDLYHKLCVSGIISEEKTYFGLVKGINGQAQAGRAYRRKMEDEDRRWRVPSMAGWELRCLLTDVFKDLRPPYPKEESPLYGLAKRLKDEDLLDGVITFNYDTSLEILFLDQFYYPLLPDQSASGRLPLLKLHGSLNWQFDSTSDPRIFAMRYSTQVADIDYQNQSRYKQPEVIGPTFFKQEINVDTQLDTRGRFYKRLWGLAWDGLRSARQLVFVGFSFPPTDFHAAALFRTAHLSGNGIEKVVLCYKRETGEENLRGIVEAVFAGGPTTVKFPDKDFDQGLENADLDKLVADLKS